MAISPVQIRPKQSGGKGGLFGKLAGGLAGAIAGSFVGNPVVGAKIGMDAGGMIGGAVDPAKQTGGRGVSTLETAAKQSPGVQQKQLLDIMDDIRTAPDLDEQKKQEVFDIFNPAIDALGRRR